ncbi:histidinol-phosphate aminotransferase [Deinobacterium chartae]|uniref:Histidinol-phosphate aminotransferase n=1 Tax=Deinobacterium chartae TaxID=521158 RepID=A0A841I575_9DEIO|nr:histidinol-phosphate transaminase [Deinobacterium chartae]MBB6099025.1 histidinol-phosphate aminotransferase [Deinobacterium chartae]
MTTSQSLPSVREAVRRTPAYPFTPIDARYKLDQNENPYDFPEELKVLVWERVRSAEWNRYPDIHADHLREVIGRYEDWDPKGIVITPGSNVLIQKITELAGIGQKVLTVKPTFAIYQLEASMLGANLTQVPLNPDFSMPVEDLGRELAAGGPGVFYVTEPHAPSGFLDDRAAVEAVLEAASNSWLTVLDEAYHQYAGCDHRDLIRGREDRVLLRTFSKAWGLAGIRLGYALTTPALATELQKLVPAFNINVLTAATVEVALENPAYMHERVREGVAERERVYARLSEHPTWQVYPSRTNFLLIRTPDASAAYRGLLERGLLVRRQDSGYTLEGCLRMGIGKPHENDAFLEAAFELS